MYSFHHVNNLKFLRYFESNSINYWNFRWSGVKEKN